MTRTTNNAEDGGAESIATTRLLRGMTTASDRMPYRLSENPFLKYPFSFLDITWKILKQNYLNIFVVFLPFGFIASLVKWSPVVIFVLNFLAMISLTSMLAFAAKDLAMSQGQTASRLLDVIFGNAVELIVSMIALRDYQIRVVQTFMLGSILSSLLLVLGCLFLVGGIKHGQQTFNSTIASTMSSLMAVASASLIIPAALYAEFKKSPERLNDSLTFISRGTSIILLLIYLSYLFFQLETYRDVFDDIDAQEGTQSEPDLLSPWVAGSVLIVSTLLVAKCAELLVDNIDSVVQDVGISKAFIGLILLPTFVNSAGYLNAVQVAFTNKMDLAIEVAIGSSLQIALFITPLLVILGWIMGREMTLQFEMFETVVFFLSTLVVTMLIQDGKSGYLEGLLCLGMYIIIALAISAYPDDSSPIFGGGPLTTNALLAAP